MGRYARLLWIQIKASALATVQYRVEFFVDATLSVVWLLVSLVPLVVLFSQRDSVAGWAWPEALLVVAWFTCVKAVLDGAIQPSLAAVVEHIRKGTLDFILLKPADAQFLLSTTRFELIKFLNVLGGIALAGFALHHLHHVPTVMQVFATVALLMGSVTILYAIWILTVSLAFFVVRVDNLSYLFSSLFEAARWPASVYRGVLSFMFTFIIPLVVITTYPALAILGRLDLTAGVSAVGGAAAFMVVARMAWLRALRHYTSAGG